MTELKRFRPVFISVQVDKGAFDSIEEGQLIGPEKGVFKKIDPNALLECQSVKRENCLICVYNADCPIADKLGYKI